MRYVSFQVKAYVQSAEVARTAWVGSVNGHLAFEAWERNLGETCDYVTLFGKTADGAVEKLESCSLNSAIRVARPLTDAAYQPRLFDFTQEEHS